MFAGMEWVVLVVAIVIIFAFGGKKIPELARSLGRAKGEFERGKREVEREIREESAKKDEGNVVAAARNLGIETEGKTEEQLKSEIAEKMK